MTRLGWVHAVAWAVLLAPAAAWGEPCRADFVVETRFDEREEDGSFSLRMPTILAALSGRPFAKRFPDAVVQEADGSSVVRIPLSDVTEVTRQGAFEKLPISPPAVESTEGAVALTLRADGLRETALRRRLRGEPDDSVILCWTLVAPGEVLEATTEEIKGREATFRLNLRDYWDRKGIELRARFAQPGASPAVSKP